MTTVASRIFLDIETIPDQREGAADAARSRIKPPSNYKDPEKIEAYIASRAEEAWRNTALDGSYGELFCIGYALDNEPAQVIYRDLQSQSVTEADLLSSFWNLLGNGLSPGGTWIGHNVQRFDLRFLWQRSVINGVPMSHKVPFDVSPWSGNVQDTMLMWTGDRNKFVSLDELLSILRINTSDPIDGSQVWDHIQADEEGIVINHCLRNVEETRQAWKTMLFATHQEGRTEHNQ